MKVFKTRDPAAHQWDRWISELHKTWQWKADHICGIVVSSTTSNLLSALRRKFGQTTIFLQLHNKLLGIKTAVAKLIQSFEGVQKLNLFLGGLLGDEKAAELFDKEVCFPDSCTKAVFDMEGAELLTYVLQKKELIRKLFFCDELQNCLHNFPNAGDFKTYEQIMKVDHCCNSFLEMCSKNLRDCPFVTPGQCILYFKILISDLMDLDFDDNAIDAKKIISMISDLFETLESKHSRQSWVASLVFDPRFKKHVLGSDSFAEEYQEIKRAIRNEVLCNDDTEEDSNSQVIGDPNPSNSLVCSRY